MDLRIEQLEDHVKRLEARILRLENDVRLLEQKADMSPEAIDDGWNE